MPRRLRIADLEEPSLRVARDRHDRVNDEVDDAAEDLQRTAGPGVLPETSSGLRSQRPEPRRLRSARNRR